jgi:hypothetical protein
VIRYQTHNNLLNERRCKIPNALTSYKITSAQWTQWKHRNIPDITYSKQINIRDLYEFLAIADSLGHDQKPGMKVYWAKNKFYVALFHSFVMPHDNFFWNICILQQSEVTNEKQRSWLCQIMKNGANSWCSKLNIFRIYLPTEHMAVDEVMIKFWGESGPLGSTFQNNMKICGIKIHTLCHRPGYTCDLIVKSKAIPIKGCGDPWGYEILKILIF